MARRLIPFEYRQAAAIVLANDPREIKAAAIAASVNLATIYRWRKDDADFLRALEAAEIERHRRG